MFVTNMFELNTTSRSCCDVPTFFLQLFNVNLRQFIQTHLMTKHHLFCTSFPTLFCKYVEIYLEKVYEAKNPQEI